MRGLRALLDMVEQAGSTRVFQAPAFGSVSNAGQGLSAPQAIQFTMNGYIIALEGSIASGAVGDYGGTAVRVQIGGTEDLFTDGQGSPTFAPFLMLFGGLPGKKRVLRRASKGDLWLFTIQNTTAGAVVPTVAVDFIADDDLRSVLASMPAQ